MKYALVHIARPTTTDHQTEGAWIGLLETTYKAIQHRTDVQHLSGGVWMIPLKGSLTALTAMFQCSLAQHLRIRVLLLEDPDWIDLHDA